jgi:hypothetical protein
MFFLVKIVNPVWIFFDFGAFPAIAATAASIPSEPIVAGCCAIRA